MIYDEEDKEEEVLIGLIRNKHKDDELVSPKHAQIPIYEPTSCYSNLPIAIPRKENLNNITPEHLPLPADVAKKEEDQLYVENPQA